MEKPSKKRKIIGYEMRRFLIVENVISQKFQRELYRACTLFSSNPEIDPKNRKNFEDLTEEEKIEFCFSKDKKDRMFTYDFNRIFEKKIPATELRWVLGQFKDQFQSKEDMPRNKKEIIQWIFSEIYGEAHNLEKRNIEKENIGKNEKTDLKFFNFFNGSVVVPFDIVSQIIAFVKKDYESLCSVGLINEKYYTMMLTHWNFVSLNKENIFNVPLLVLQNVKEVLFESHNKVTTQENEYIIESLKSVKKFRFRSKYVDFRFFNTWNKKRIVWEKCTNFKVDYYNTSKKKPFCLPFDLLPNLRTLEIVQPSLSFTDRFGRNKTLSGEKLQQLECLKMGFFTDEYLEYFKNPKLPKLKSFETGRVSFDNIRSLSEIETLERLKVSADSIKKLEGKKIGDSFGQIKELKELCFTFYDNFNLVKESDITSVLEYCKGCTQESLNLNFKLGKMWIDTKTIFQLNVKEEKLISALNKIDWDFYSNLKELKLSVDFGVDRAMFKYFYYSLNQITKAKGKEYIEKQRYEKKMMNLFFKGVLNKSKIPKSVKTSIEFYGFD